MAAVLTSWKEIASYLGKGVRTVQRWERELGLPVRRPKPKNKQIVLAFPDELDFWLKDSDLSKVNVHSSTSEEIVRMRLLVKNMVEQTRVVHERTAELVKLLNLGRETDPKCWIICGEARQNAPVLDVGNAARSLASSVTVHSNATGPRVLPSKDSERGPTPIRIPSLES